MSAPQAGPSPRLVAVMRALAVLFALLMVELLAAAAFGFDPIDGPVAAWQLTAQVVRTAWDWLVMLLAGAL